MRFFKLTVAYNGRDFFGWQWQPGLRTVQAVLEEAIAEVTQQPVRAIASGRTDAGVHARAQVVSIACETAMNAATLRKAINANLPEDVFVHAIEDAPHGFHATRDAIRKRYVYVIQDGKNRDVFARGYSWYVRSTLDADAMHRAAQALVGEHDFSSFESTGSARLDSIRTIFALNVSRRWIETSSRIMMEVEADGFLYNMVRNIVGTLYEVGRGRRSEAWPAEVLAARDRTVAGQAAPPHGLYLDYVEFSQDNGPAPPESAELGSQP